MRLDTRTALEKEETNRWIEKDRQRRLLAEQRQQEELESERREILNWKERREGNETRQQSGTTIENVHKVEKDTALPDASLGARKTVRFANIDTDTDDDDDDDVDDDDESDDEGGDSDPGVQRIGEEHQTHLDNDEERHAGCGLQIASIESCSPPLPPPRQQTTAEITFTQLETDHMPARANREDEIREWKRANNVPKRNPNALTGDDDDEGDLSTRHPMFVKDKADELLKHGDYGAAVRMYNRCLAIDNTFVPALNNRSCCFFKIGKYLECASDCTSVIDILRGSGEDQDASGAREALNEKVAKMLKRRGLSRALMSSTGDERDMSLDALADLKAAAKTLKEDAELDHNIMELQMAVLDSDDGDGGEESPRERRDAMIAQKMYALGANRLSGGDFQGAEEAFTSAIGLLENSVNNSSGCCSGSAHTAAEDLEEKTDDRERWEALCLRTRCLVNRATVYLQLGSYNRCIQESQDVEASVRLLREAPDGEQQVASPDEEVLISKIEAMALSRRGLAQCNLRHYGEAIKSLSASHAIFADLNLGDEAGRIAEDMQEVERKLAAKELCA